MEAQKQVTTAISRHSGHSNPPEGLMNCCTSTDVAVWIAAIDCTDLYAATSDSPCVDVLGQTHSTALQSYLRC